MQQYHVSYSQLSVDDPQTRLMISKLLSAASCTVGFDHSDKRLFIETYPDDDGGCILYVTVMKGEKYKESKSKRPSVFPPVIFTLPSVNSLCQICKTINCNEKSQALCSSLFSHADEYDLVLIGTSLSWDRWNYIASEWSIPIHQGKNELLRVQEHGRLLIPSGAVETMAKL